MCIDIRHRTDQLREISAKNEELESRTRITTDSLKNEINRCEDENLKRDDHIKMLQKDSNQLHNALYDMQCQSSSVENELHTLQRIHEKSVTDLANNIRKLEEDNYNLSIIKDSLTSTLHAHTTEYRNLDISLKDARDVADKREVNFNNTIK